VSSRSVPIRLASSCCWAPLLRPQAKQSWRSSAWVLLAPISINVIERLISKLIFGNLDKSILVLFFTGFASLIVGGIEISSSPGISLGSVPRLAGPWLLGFTQLKGDAAFRRRRQPLRPYG